MPLRRLLPLLSCPLCAVDGGVPCPILRNPFTLHCGHTVCLSHLERPDPTQRCPLPVCSSTPGPNTARPNIPSSSRVIYLPPVPPPASAQQPSSTAADQFGQRVDVTVSKLIEVVSRHSRPPPSPSNQEDSDAEDHPSHAAERPPPPQTLPSSDEETDHPVTQDLGRSSGLRRRRRPVPELSQPAIPGHSELISTSPSSTNVVSADLIDGVLPASSGRAGRSCAPPPRTAEEENSDGSDSSTEPPKKRPRRDTRSLVTDRGTQSRSIEPGAETGSSESSNHTNVDALQPNRLDPESRRGPEEGDDNLHTRVEKELLTELSCEICFTIYYQPVTTPCQHVSCTLSFSFHSAFFRFLFRASIQILFGVFCDTAPVSPQPYHVFSPPQPGVKFGGFCSIFTGVPLSRGAFHLTAFFGRHSAADAFKGR